MSGSSLADLVAPVAPEAFLDDTWGRGPRLFPASMAGRVEDLLDLAALEELLATTPGADHGWLHLANGTRRAVPREMVDSEGMLDLAQVRAAFAAGDSLYLTKAERLSSSLLALTRAVEVDLTGCGVALRRPVNAHVFLTPPGAQAFLPHRDEHASFVVQLEGCKRWTVYPRPPGNAAPGALDPASLPTADRDTFHLGPGDVLYVPEWWPHEAHTGDAHSLHVTLRVFPLRWGDVLGEVSVSHPALAGVVPRCAHGSPERLADALVELLATPAFQRQLAPLVGSMLRRRRVPDVVMAGDGLRQVLAAGTIDEGTVLERCAGTTCEVWLDGEEAALAFPGGTLRGPAALLEVLRAVAAADTMRPADLPDIAGGPYDKVELARRLVAGGLLRAARLAPAGPARRPAGRRGPGDGH